MHLEVLIEERSAEPVVRHLVSELGPDDLSLGIRTFEGKVDLLASLAERMQGYRNWGVDLRILVLVDKDNDDCHELKSTLERVAADAGFLTRATAAGGTFHVCNRVAVEELEAWLLGDEAAMRSAFPRLKPFAAKAKYRDPDSMTSTWEATQRLLQRSGYYAAGLRKADLAGRVAPHLNVSRNRSTSFRVFAEGLEALVSQ